MKILYVGMSARLGGIESFIMNIYRNIDTRKIRIDFVKYSGIMCYEEEIKHNGSKIYVLPSRGFNFLSHYCSLIKFFRKHREYDIVHYHLNTASCISALVVAKCFGIKTIAHSHNEYKGNRLISAIFHRVNKQILPIVSDINLACSDVAGKDMFRKKTYTVVRNGIDTLKFVFNENCRKKIRTELNVDDDELLIGHIGAFKYQKNHTFLIDIFSELLKVKNNSKLILVGDGELKDEIKEKVRNLNIQDSVVFLGVRSDISALLNAMDVFVFPSHYEGLGIVVIEAQATGLPTIVSDGIPKEAQVTNLIHFHSLNKSAKDWRQFIFDMNLSVDRTSYHSCIKENGYDCASSAKLLETIYNSIIV